MSAEPQGDIRSSVERLLDAIDLIETGDKESARPILRGLIQENSDFEDAWLWMSVAVDSVDQSIVSLENVLRINPQNARAAKALFRLRQRDVLSEQRRSHLEFVRDTARTIFWLIVTTLLFSMMFTSFFEMGSAT